MCSSLIFFFFCIKVIFPDVRFCGLDWHSLSNTPKSILVSINDFNIKVPGRIVTAHVNDDWWIPNRYFYLVYWALVPVNLYFWSFFWTELCHMMMNMQIKQTEIWWMSRFNGKTASSKWKMKKGRRGRKEKKGKIKLWSLKLEREKNQVSRLGNGAKGSRTIRWMNQRGIIRFHDEQFKWSRNKNRSDGGDCTKEMELTSHRAWTSFRALCSFCWLEYYNTDNFIHFLIPQVFI